MHHEIPGWTAPRRHGPTCRASYTFRSQGHIAPGLHGSMSMPRQSQHFSSISGCCVVRVSFCLCLVGPTAWGPRSQWICHQQEPGTRRETERTAQGSGCGTTDWQSFVDFDHLASQCKRIEATVPKILYAVASWRWIEPVRLSYKSYFFSIFFSHNKLTNNIFNHNFF